ncbi:MAG: hypothetical protein J5841_09700 [Clostridia bacterium]|nr:hypothetical protein [Clostridia bacterium]
MPAAENFCKKTREYVKIGSEIRKGLPKKVFENLDYAFSEGAQYEAYSTLERIAKALGGKLTVSIAVPDGQ